MDDTNSSRRRRNRSSSKTTSLHETDGREPSFQDGGDPAVWATFSENFHQVQSVLDRNRLLIQQVNENHQSKIHDNMVKNVELIQEINGNITKVVSLYSNLSSDFMTAVNHRSAAKSNSESEEKQ
ncbi:protein EARLY FLOWERING 4 [Andrographis paniculata]|uniref:protein EARLY FLOWERING 4 n=1 Tax=Andrographis paniculata TaxID=175694 RepID=UPI0021E8AEAF|nr:protein EARLY FLOWERING 4 [Andrographis paniculata]